ncbi:hypothetical protein SCUCBS95973_001025 [Sporothrix curviconia]|uniref:Heterokaryon incompatibility domain-containing protein n=1 Tax=Sporothrix curviconia TaxID=1260050 RepID=A0ABP0AV58_9PEZI
MATTTTTTTTTTATIAATAPLDIQVYVYTPLTVADKQIRVLVVEPGSADDPVAASVVHISLLERPVPQYEAISYSWSAVRGTGSIILDGMIVRVPAAAEEALRYMRHGDAKRSLWIDAICINQNDLEERGQQVAIMGEVYSQSTGTLIWLGSGDRDGEAITQRAFAGLGALHEQLLQETDKGTRLRDVLYGSTNIFQYATTPLPPGVDFAAIQALFRRHWFGRRWVVQDSALAPRGRFYCRDSGTATLSMDMQQFFGAAVWIQHKQHVLPFDLDAEEGMLNAAYLSPYVNGEQGFFEHDKQGICLADLLRSFRNFAVSDARDCVYALLGLTRWPSRGETLPALVTPDYHKTGSDVFHDATRLAMRETGDLWLFRYIDHGRALPPQGGTPSWVPAIFKKLDPKQEPNYMRSAFQAYKGMPEEEGQGNYDEGADGRLLRVRGVVVDPVESTGPVFGPELFRDITGTADIVRRVLHDRCLVQDGDDGARQHAALASLAFADLGMVLVAGSTFDQRPVEGPDEDVSIFAQFMEALEGAAEQDQQKTLETLEDPLFSRCVWAIRYACQSRRLFVTQDGHVALGPQITQPGDVVCVLAGSRMPVVLRPSGDASNEWSVLGPCYVHGIMQGEAVVERLAFVVTFKLR